MCTNRPSRKLNDKNAGLFPVVRQINPRSYELDLPAKMQLQTRVFHSSLLELARQDPLPGQVNAPPPQVVIRDHQEWLVEDILDFRWHYGVLQYCVGWTGHRERTWGPWYHVKDYVFLPRFHARYPRKPGPMPPDAQPPLGLDLEALELRRSSAPRGGLLSRRKLGNPEPGQVIVPGRLGDITTLTTFPS